MSVTEPANAIRWNIVNKNLTPGLTVTERLSQKIASLARLLIHFPPDTLHLQVVLEKLAKRGLYEVRLTLRLPSNILHAEKSSEDLLAAINAAADALKREITSLKAELRGDYRWKRPARRAQLNTEKELVFAPPMTDGIGPQTEADVVGDLYAAHHQHLLAHVHRVLRMAELTGDLPAHAIDAGDVVDEVARIVCDTSHSRKPATMSYEQWFYRLVQDEVDKQIRHFFEESRLRVVADGSFPASPDEAEGYVAEQPLDLITNQIEPEEPLPEERFADQECVPPDSMAAGRELVEKIQQEVKSWPPLERQVFELHYLVGFDVGDVAMISGRSEAEVQTLIGKAQLRLRNFLHHTASLSV